MADRPAVRPNWARLLSASVRHGNRFFGKHIGSVGLRRSKAGDAGPAQIAVDQQCFVTLLRGDGRLVAMVDFPQKANLDDHQRFAFEGKSTIATNLAIRHAQQGHKTLLIDGDLRRPSVHRRLDLPSTAGLTDVLTEEQLPWREVLTRIEAVPNLDVLLAGPPSRRACDLVGMGLAEILEDARKEYDLDHSRFCRRCWAFRKAVADVSALVDGVLRLVARSGQTAKRAGALFRRFTRLRANVLGIVMNEVRADTSDTYYYQYYHPKYYSNYNKAMK